MCFSKNIMIFACCMIAFIVLLCSVSWLVWREMPEDILSYGKWIFGACTAFYMVKSGYENGEKIKKSDDEKWWK